MIRTVRQPYAYGTSHRLDLVQLVLADGTTREALLKDLSRSGPVVKPAFLDDPQREVEAYRILADTGLGIPTCYASGENWLLIEKVPGVELWQVAELDAWVAAAQWLRRLHGHFAAHPPSSDRLVRYDAAYFRQWPNRVRPRHSSLVRVLAGYERVIEILSRLPRTLIHGEFYASNVLIAGDRVAGVDWEMSGVGPGVLDLAALVTGWEGDYRGAILAGYGDVSHEALDAAQLHLAVQWLGWSADWTPPPEHARDWVAEALQAAERLGI